jgi:enoyl-CoA hydratase
MDLVNVSLTDGVATLSLNQPDQRNSLTLPMVHEIVAAFDRFEANPKVGAVIVTGEGSAFCAGANLGNLAEADRTSLKTIYEGFLRVGRSPLPTIAAVNGAAVGAGMNLALACDLRIAARRARFDCRFVDLGIHPGGGHTWMLRRIVGPQTAVAMVVFGQILDGAQAERVGLAYRCVDDDDLLTTAHEFAARAASGPRELVIEVKKSLNAMAMIDTHDQAVDTELTPQLWSVKQPWFAERLAQLQSKISSKK